jgi:hypothetical protein
MSAPTFEVRSIECGVHCDVGGGHGHLTNEGCVSETFPNTMSEDARF